MPGDDLEDTLLYKVVINHEEQYSIWPVDRENAAGWQDAGKSGSKAECLTFIKEVWTERTFYSLPPPHFTGIDSGPKRHTWWTRLSSPKKCR